MTAHMGAQYVSRFPLSDNEDQFNTSEDLAEALCAAMKANKAAFGHFLPPVFGVLNMADAYLLDVSCVFDANPDPSDGYLADRIEGHAGDLALYKLVRDKLKQPAPETCL